MSKTVVVGCKLPNGLVINYGGTNATLAGTNSSLIEGGHGLTTVDKDFWDLWLSEHKDYAPVAKGLIFAHEKEVNAKAEAKEKAKNKNGFEAAEKVGRGIEELSAE